MPYKLLREVEGGKVVGLRLGVEKVDAYLDFIRDRCRPHTWLSIGYDLQVFLNEVNKPVLDVTSRDILTFIERQRKIPPVDNHEDSRTAQSKSPTGCPRDRAFATHCKSPSVHYLGSL